MEWIEIYTTEKVSIGFQKVKLLPPPLPIF